VGDLCSADRVHPNDLGNYFMAEAIYKVLKPALEK
jgi:lysophospholipase L1-like esterase